MRFDLPGIIGGFDAGDLRWRGGKIGLDVGVGTSTSHTASALEGDLPCLVVALSTNIRLAKASNITRFGAYEPYLDEDDTNNQSQAVDDQS